MTQLARGCADRGEALAHRCPSPSEQRWGMDGHSAADQPAFVKYFYTYIYDVIKSINCFVF